MNEIIAVRRNIGANGVFYRQNGLDVEYSLDNEIWFHAFRLNSQTTTTGGNIDVLADLEKTIEKYSKKYYLELDFKALINIDVTVNTRNDAIANPPERAFNPLRLCLALRVFLRSMRDLGLGISNGNIETDDIRRFGALARKTATDASLALFGGSLAGKVIGGAFEASFTIWEAFSWAFAQYWGNWTNEQIDDITCCLYEQLKTGEFNYSEFVSAGELCQLGAWDEIATPQNYAGLVTMVAYGDLPTDGCPCEDCLLYLPTDGLVTRGFIINNTLLTANYTVSGGLIRMGSVVEFTIPNMVLTDIRILVNNVPYENLADSSVPRVRLFSGGITSFTDLPGGLNWVQLDPSNYPLVAVDKIVIDINSSTCSACNTSQRALYDQSFASLIFIIVCGILQ